MAEAETSTGNITELRPRPKPSKAAIRQRRYRRRRNAAKTEAITPAKPVTPAVTPDRHRAVMLVAALSLAICSAAFSITGLTSIFAGAFWPVIGMGCAFELGKLASVAWLGQRYGSPSLRAALMVLVVILMALNSLGVYGFLSKAHIAHAVASEVAVDGRAAQIEAQRTTQAAVVADLDRQIAQVDLAIDEIAKRGRGRAALALAEQQQTHRADLVASRMKEAKALAALQVETAAVIGERQEVEADLGPVRYLATLIGASDTQTMRWFILVVALLLDPAAVLLLLGATAKR